MSIKARDVAMLSAGMVLGIGLIVSCGDHLPTMVASVDASIDAVKSPDAAPTCDCAPAEPPLGNRFIVANTVKTIPPNSTAPIYVACPILHRTFTGACTYDASGGRNVTLMQSGFTFGDGGQWMCEYRNNEAVAITFRATILCLQPPP